MKLFQPTVQTLKLSNIVKVQYFLLKYIGLSKYVDALRWLTFYQVTLNHHITLLRWTYQQCCLFGRLLFFEQKLSIGIHLTPLFLSPPRKITHSIAANLSDVRWWTGTHNRFSQHHRCLLQLELETTIMRVTS